MAWISSGLSKGIDTDRTPKRESFERMLWHRGFKLQATGIKWPRDFAATDDTYAETWFVYQNHADYMRAGTGQVSFTVKFGA